MMKEQSGLMPTTKSSKIEHPVVQVGWKKFPSLFVEKKYRGKPIKKQPVSKVDETEVLQKIKTIADKI